jgi:predicted transcriptional regulator
VETSDFSNGTDDDEWTWESIRDLHTLTYGVSRVKLPHRPVKTAMIKNVINVTMNTEVSECALKMRRARVDQVPIVNSDRKLVSVLYDRDLIGALCREPART